MYDLSSIEGACKHIRINNFYPAESFLKSRKQPIFGDATSFHVKWRLRNVRRKSVLMTCHYPDLGSASGWLNISHDQSEAEPVSLGGVGHMQILHCRGAGHLSIRRSWNWLKHKVAKCRLFSISQTVSYTTSQKHTGWANLVQKTLDPLVLVFLISNQLVSIDGGDEMCFLF